MALKARARAARRRELEREIPDRSAGPPEEAAHRELRALLDAELNRLPEKYRLPVVLCHLEGLTNEEAARTLGWPAGTVKGRLSRARDLLRARLTRRGLGLTLGALAAGLSEQAAAGGVPAGVAEVTVKAAQQFAAGDKAVAGAVSAGVAALTERVLRAMLLTRLKTLTAIGLVLTILLGGAGLLAYRALAGEPDAVEGKSPSRPERKAASEMTTLLKERVQIAADGFKMARQIYLVGRLPGEQVISWSKKWLEAERELSGEKSRQVAACKAHLDRVKEVEQMEKAKFEAGRDVATEYLRAQYARVEAEIWLARAKSR